MRYCTKESVLTLLILAGAAIAAGLHPAAAASCTTKAGSATGLTRGFAEYEALLIIRQTTGNWPIQTDAISKPIYRCRQGNVLWSCFATAKVCRK